MPADRSIKPKDEKKKLQYKLTIIEALVIGLPFLVFSYLIYTHDISLNFYEVTLLILVLILIQIGLIILRHIFSGIMNIVTHMKQIEDSKAREIQLKDDTSELHEISVAFNKLMTRFEDTNSELKQRVFELFAIKELIDISSKSIDIEQLLNVLLDKAMKVTKSEVGSVFLVEPEDRRFLVVGSSGQGHLPLTGQYVKFEDSILQAVVSEKQPLIIEDVNMDPRAQEYDYPAFGAESLLAMPILVGRDVVAVMGLFEKETGEPFDPNDEQVLSIMIGEVGFALENAQLHLKLKEAEKRYELATSSGGVGVWDWNLNTDEMYIDPKLKAILGYEDHEIKNHLDDWNRHVHPDDREQLMAQARAHIEGLAPQYEYSHRRLHKDGSIRWFLGRGAVIKDEHGAPRRLTGTDTDITQIKRMEEELIRLQKLESVGVLAGGIAHDFNNLLTAILGNISLAKEIGATGREAADILEKAEKSCLKAEELTKQLITFARGGAPIKKATDIRETIRDAISFALSGSKVGCDFEIAEDLWPVEVDIGQFRQVIYNLCINADQAMPEGGELIVTAENVMLKGDHSLPIKDGKYVRISFKDTGPGIPGDELDKIFDPFFTTREGASGLGLAMAYSIVQQHSGHITVESEPGAGTTFHLYLPAARGEAEEAIEEGAEQQGGGGRILVMDDEEDIRKLARDILRLAGYEVVEADDGARAVDYYKEAMAEGRPFDAVIMDLTVPGGMGGKETVEKLREIDPGVKAIVASGYSTDPVMAEPGKHGFKASITKPFIPDSLREIVKAVLKGQ